MKRPGFEARIMPALKRSPEHPHLTVWVRLDLGAGPEWIAVAYVRKP